MYSSGEQWHTWMKDFRFGTLVFIPSGDCRATVDRLRNEYDPDSAKTSMAHVTLTQPLTKAPTDDDVRRLETVIGGFRSFDISVGPAATSPNKRLVWFDVAPKESVLALREALHETGLFRTDLPLTKGFIPHMTISELRRDPEEVTSTNKTLNSNYKPWSLEFGSVAWIIPDEDFVFREFREFELEK